MDDTLTDDCVDASLDRRGGEHAPGTQVGRYLLAELIGRGATSAVYAAYDPELGRTVALKLIAGGRGPRGERLVKEARALAAINHPNVVTVHDVGSADDTMFIAMELVPGRTLTRWQESKPPRAERLRVLAQAARGLAAAHETGLVHRDVKPDNIMIADDGRVVVLDFGLVQIMEADPAMPRPADDLSTGGTKTVGRVGTPAYMAPEQYVGLETSARSDQFSFCVVVWESLYGERPFGKGSLADVMRRTVDGPGEVPRRQRVDRRLHATIVRGLAATPDERLPSLTPLIEALERKPVSRVTIAAGLTIGLAVGGTVWKSTGPDARCADPGAPVEDVWNEAERQNLLRAADEDTVVLAPTDRYADHLRDTWRTACAATEDGTLAAFEGVDRCLLLRRHALQTTLEAIGEKGDLEVRVIVDAIHALPDPARCLSDPGKLAPPPDRSVAATVDALERELEEARSQRSLGDLKRAVELLDALDARIVAHGYLPQLAQARLDRALAASNLAADDRIERLENAYTLAVEARDHETAALSASGLTRELGNVDARHDAARSWAKVARAHLANSDLGVEEELRLDEALAGTQLREGKLEEALATYLAALKRAENELGPTSTLPMTLHSNVATAFSRLNRFEEAKSHYAEAREDLQERYGERSVLVAHHLANEGYNLAALEEYDAAERMLEQSIAIIEFRVGPEHPLSVVPRSNLTRIRMTRGDIAGAAEAAKGTIEMAEARFGANHIVTSLVVLRVGWVRERAGDLEAAEAAFRRSDASLIAAAGEADNRRWRPLAALGGLELRRGAPERALTLLRDAASRLTHDPGADRFERAMVSLRLGRAEIESGHDVAGGTARATAAAAQLVDGGQAWEFMQPELAPFLPAG